MTPAAPERRHAGRPVCVLRRTHRRTRCTGPLGLSIAAALLAIIAVPALAQGGVQGNAQGHTGGAVPQAAAPATPANPGGAVAPGQPAMRQGGTTAGQAQPATRPPGATHQSATQGASQGASQGATQQGSTRPAIPPAAGQAPRATN
jgi:hypothetical protein